MSAGNTATGRSRSAPAIQRQAGTGQHQQYSDRQEQVSTSNTTGRSRLAPAIQQPPGTGRLRRPLSVRRNKKSAQPDATNTAAYRHLPIHYPIPQRRTATCPERGSARGKSGLRNSERLSPSQTCPRQSVPPKGKELHCQSVPPGKKLSVRRHRLSAQERPSDARHCTISGTIFSLFLSIIQLHVYYKEHTSKLLTLNSESVILWSS